MTLSVVFCGVQDGVEREFDDGDVLVETEPVRYELSNVRLQLRRRRVTRREVQVLATAQLRNGVATIPMRADAALGYERVQRLYWGHGRATLRALPTVVRAENGSVLDQIEWGIEDEHRTQNFFQ